MDQLIFDFDAPATDEPPKVIPDHLILMMDKGYILGDVLSECVKQGCTEVTLSEKGITAYDTTTAYPKGIMVDGKGSATFNPEILSRILVKGKIAKSLKTINVVGFTQNNAPRFKGFDGLGKEFVELHINGSVEIRKGKFTATIKTSPLPVRP